MTIRQVIIEIHQQLSGQYPGTEIDSFVRILFGHYLGMTPVLVHLSQDNEMPVEIEQQIRTAINELKKNRPIQYILGETEFYGLKFEVTPDVLIPRPETEELVDWIVHEYNKNAGLTMVDIGTGSGCIAVALAANFPNAKLWAIDVSDAALAVAQRNAVKNNVKASLSTREREIRASQENWDNTKGDVCKALEDNSSPSTRRHCVSPPEQRSRAVPLRSAGVGDRVNFLLADVLKGDLMGFEPGSLDVIVSNPPYIAPSEKQQMLANVLEYEPHIALFVPEDDPLIFYKRIAAFGSECLKDGGRVFFEINEAYSQGVADVLAQQGYSDIVPHKDINGKWRMVSAGLSFRPLLG